MTDAKQLLTMARAIQDDIDALGLGKPHNNFHDGELVVQQQAIPPGDCPPDVFRFRIRGVEMDLCLNCALQRTRGAWDDGPVSFIEDGMCEDCGNNDGEKAPCA